MEIKIKSKNNNGDLILEKLLKEKTLGVCKVKLTLEIPKTVTIKLFNVPKAISKLVDNENLKVFIRAEVSKIIRKYGGKPTDFVVTLK